MVQDAKIDAPGADLLENITISLDDALDALDNKQPITFRIPLEPLARWDLVVVAQLQPRETSVPAPASEPAPAATS